MIAIASQHRDIIPHFDEAHVNQGP
jgi:hypothetical protein